MELSELQIINPALKSENQALSMYHDFMDRVRSWIPTWSAQLDVKPGSRRNYLLGVRRFLDFCDSRGVQVPTRGDLIQFKDFLLNDEGVRPNTVSLYLTANRIFWRAVSIEAGFAGLNIGSSVKGPREAPGHRRDAFTLEQTDLIREHAASLRSSLIGLRNFAVVDLMSHTGLRTIEISRALIGDLRQKEGRDVLYVFGKGCSGPSEMVILKSCVRKSIDAYLLERFKGRKIDLTLPLFAGHARSGNGSSGKSLTPEMIRIFFRGFMRSVGIVNNRLSCHSLRHFVASHAISQGVDVLRVQTLLRHRDISSTMIYIHQFSRFQNPPEDAISLAPC